MSLLLDALKKAADDKQKATEKEPNQSDVRDSGETNVDLVEEKPPASDEVQTSNEELSLQQNDGLKDPVETAQQNDVQNPGEHDDEELTLDELEPAPDAAPPASEAQTGSEEASEQELSLEKSAGHNANRRNNAYTVSDDALSMLIYKTNRDVKYSRKIFFIVVSIATLVVLISGGVYYYLDMQAEIISLERKHKIAMQSMRLKTNREKVPQKSEIIRNLVGETGLNEKVQFAKQQIAGKKHTGQMQSGAQSVASRQSQDVNPAQPAMSIQKTHKSDPVGEKLDAAWLAYESARYDEAGKLYRDILTVEDNNRDAMLGLGAIAVIKKNNIQARNIYSLLLEQDPRDPIATAAMASLNNSESSLKNDEEYLLSMLQKNPDTPHLNFALGNNYAQQNKWKPAQQYYFNAWQQDNKNADYIFNLAVSMDQLNKEQQALNFYKDSLLKSENKQVSFSREAVQKRIQEISGL